MWDAWPAMVCITTNKLYLLFQALQLARQLMAQEEEEEEGREHT